MKRHIVRLLSRFYPIFPKPGLFDDHANPVIATKRFIQQKVSELTGNAMFISGILKPEVSDLASRCKLNLTGKNSNRYLHMLIQLFGSSFT